MTSIGIDYLTLTGVSPPQFIRTAAAAGARSVSLFPSLGEGFGLPASTHFSLVEDAALRRETKSCAADTGVTLALMEALLILPDQSVERFRPTFEMIAELGVPRAGTISLEPSWERTVDELQALVTLGAEYGVTIMIEPCGLSTVGTLAQALQLIDAMARPNLKLLIDTLHIARSGELEDLVRVDPALIDYVQISDAPLRHPGSEAYMEEATHERLIPGEGELPLARMLSRVRPDTPISGEVPMRNYREAGFSDLEQLLRIIEGIRRALAA